MDLHDQKNIQYCPYSGIITYPPKEIHAATFAKIVFVQHGSCVINFFNKKEHKLASFVCKEGDCFIAHAYLPYQFIFDDKKQYAHRDIYLSDEQLKEYSTFVDPNLCEEIFSNPVPKVFKLSSPSLIYYSERLSMLLGEGKNAKRDSIHKSIIIDILTQYLTYGGEEAAKPSWLNKLLRNIDSEEFLLKSVEDIVKTTNYSHGYVNREFKKFMHCSLKHFINNRKLELSSVMLATSEISLQEIVIRLGFATTSSFITQFKEKYNITPWKFRKAQSAFITKEENFEAKV